MLGPGARGGVDLGGTKILAVVVDADHTILGEARHDTPTKGGPKAVAAEIVTAVRQAAEAAGGEPSELEGIGVGSPGAVDTAKGTVANARNLPDWIKPFPLASTLEQELGPPVLIGNDVGVAVDAEAALGAGAGAASFIALWWGTGIGGAFVIDGKRWLGRGAAGEIGHTVIKLGGRRCSCGRRGCVEAYAGRAALEARARRLHADGADTNLLEIMKKRGRDRMTSGVWERALHEGDHLAGQLIDEAVQAIGGGLASEINFLDAEAIVVGGGLGTRLADPYVERIRDAMIPHLFVPERPPRVLPAGLGDLSGAMGAALLAAHAVKAAG
jgi:glucokinase